MHVKLCDSMKTQMSGGSLGPPNKVIHIIKKNLDDIKNTSKFGTFEKWRYYGCGVGGVYLPLFKRLS